MVQRVYVENREGGHAAALSAEYGVAVRMLNRYDVEGTTDAEFDPYDVDVSFNGVRVCTAGGPDRPREEVDLTPRRTEILIDLRVGTATATILTNDLTHDYVHENSAYSS